MKTLSGRTLTCLLLGLAVLAVSPRASAQSSPMCFVDSPPYSINWQGFRSRDDIPLPDNLLPETLFYDNVPVPPNAIKGLATPGLIYPGWGLYGFHFEGVFYTSGAGTADGSFSHSAVFYHDVQSTIGANEYGFVSDLRNGRVLFYTCGDCNTSSQRWAQTTLVAGWLNGTPMSYDVKVTSSGNFQVEVRKLSDNSVVYSATISKPSWLPNLFKADGYMTAVFQTRVNRFEFYNSYLQIDDIKVWLPQCYGKIK